MFSPMSLELKTAVNKFSRPDYRYYIRQTISLKLYGYKEKQHFYYRINFYYKFKKLQNFKQLR